MSIKFLINNLLLLAILCCSTIAFGQQEHLTQDFSREGRVVKIDILKLLPDVKEVRGKGRYNYLHEKLRAGKLDDFFVSNRIDQNCSNELKEGFECIEIINAQIGHFYRDAHFESTYNGLFRSYNQGSTNLEIFYQKELNRYFIRKPWTDFYGPFNGEPLEELKRAIISFKEKRDFSKVNLTYLSRRWEFPDEKDALVSRINGHYDCAHGHSAGRFTEDMKLNSQFLKFRLENNSEKTVFVLYNSSKPYAFGIERFKKAGVWKLSKYSDIDHPQFSLYGYYQWIPLPANSALEFEVKGQCNIRTICKLGLYINDNGYFWDTDKIAEVFPSYKRREFSKENAPPKSSYFISP